MQRRGVNGSHGPDVAREADMKECRLNGGLRVSCARQRCRATADGKQLTISDPLQAPSAGLAIPAAISFASFAQFVLVEAGLSQFGARIPPHWSLAGLPVSAAISLAPLAQHVLSRHAAVARIPRPPYGRLPVQSQGIGKRPRPELQKEQLPLRRRTQIFAFLATFLILQLVWVAGPPLLVGAHPNLVV
jgi:hypothetical protein